MPIRIISKCASGKIIVPAVAAACEIVLRLVFLKATRHFSNSAICFLVYSGKAGFFAAAK